ncbi:putative hmg box protein [Daldinia childiae]|uniref:putative hmg box protein n=1 Tax=Daldinia childiae TaxID=326645 RepID=UPI0014456AE0|nr:putative hmg box protein [Daldinia childiae]KAF3056587.1 putative hmg box protein [Daldinia childiae]
MLSSIGRAAIRRLVSTSATTTPRRIAISWPISRGRGFVQGFATAGQPKASTATKTTTKTSKPKATKTTKTTNATKAKSTRATKGTTKATATKARPKKATKAKATKSKGKGRAVRKRKQLSPKKQAILEKRMLKKTALFDEPKLLPDSPWTVYVAEQTKNKSTSPSDLRARMVELAQNYRNIPASELQRLADTGAQNKLNNAAAYASWVEDHTPDQTVAANRARQLLKRKYNFPVATLKVIHDPRVPKRPITPYSLFTKARWASGDFANRPFTEVSREIGKEWVRLADVERHAYDDLGKAARDEYEKEVEAVLHRKPASPRRSAKPPA